ncbi:hypothetical protein SAMN02800692_3870 [Luteibacter sp. UNC138MFCol5.1]|uniref:hypothetical protein n=1 Tax=Luteibacter sp. UNC138MFCol5.1 TaxID=1502774 RepID=UPI0008BE5E36|nr:hypothetical protein [Luteibacter sp. UNC138MFCol5.1]SEP13370.1 hypothetical protein SAMN02800692_3870 [Luteibacter sp. UNC138MFCol5.1]
MNTRHFLIAAVLAGGACATAQAADLPRHRAVPDAQLDRIRGGYDFGDNLRASFALQRTVLINGMEAMRTSISVPDIATMTADQAAALQNALRTTIVTNGMGEVAGSVPGVQAPAVTAPSAVAPAAAAANGAAASANGNAANAGAASAAVVATLPSASLPGLVVQNSLDNQAIMATTTIDASVNTANMLQNMRVSESIRDAVIQFRGN